VLVCLAGLPSSASAARKKAFHTGTSVSISDTKIGGRVVSELSRCDRGATVRVFQLRSRKNPTVIADLGTSVSDRNGHWSIPLSAELHNVTLSFLVKRRVVCHQGQRVVCGRGGSQATLVG
jgi:hypothetical protein